MVLNSVRELTTFTSVIFRLTCVITVVPFHYFTISCFQHVHVQDVRPERIRQSGLSEYLERLCVAIGDSVTSKLCGEKTMLP